MFRKLLHFFLLKKNMEESIIRFMERHVTMDDNKDFIKWEKKFELGIPVIDSQHRQLVNLCNDLYQAVIRNKYRATTPGWHEALSDALRETVNYINTHFSDEEKLLTAVNYDKLDQQKSQHKSFTNKISETLKTFNQATFQDAMDFVRFLYDWILQHIAISDKQYVPAVLEYLKNRQ